MRERIRDILLGLLTAIAILVLVWRPVSADAYMWLNTSQKTIYAGNTYQLTLFGDVSDTVWSSSDSAVADVSQNGLVTALSKGSATITATSGNDRRVCKITVKKPYLSDKTVYMQIGESIKIKLTGATVASYKSSKKSVAKVTAKGNIYAKKAGKAVITVTDTNQKTYKCTVFVIAKLTEADNDMVIPTVSPLPVVKPDPNPTGIPVPVVPTPTAAVMDVPTATPAPVITSRPTATPVPVATSRPTATPAPTATLMPTATPTPAVVQLPTAGIDPSILQVYSEADVVNACSTDTAVSTLDELDNAIVDAFIGHGYYSIRFLISDLNVLRTESEYNALLCGIVGLRINSMTKYTNGVSVEFRSESTGEYVRFRALEYAFRSGDTSVLSDNSLFLYQSVESVIASLSLAGESDISKLAAIHDYLVLNTKYAIEEANANNVPAAYHGAEGPFKYGRSVCDGYAEAFYLLANKLGFDARIISGRANGGSHAWNLVNVGGSWYHVDVTWDDPVPDQPGETRYEYFLVSDSKMSRDHTWRSDISCTTEYYYEVELYRNYICYTTTDAVNAARAQIGTGEDIYILYPNNGTMTHSQILDAYMGNVNRYVSYYYPREVGDYLLLQIQNPYK